MSRLTLPALAGGLAVLLGASAAGAADLPSGGPVVYDLRHGAAFHHRPRTAWHRAPPVVRYGAPARLPARPGTGYGFGSTGYGYGGDFSTAYTSGYDDFQTIGYATPDGTYGGQPFGHGYYGPAGYGYGGTGGWAPGVPPAGGLAVYSPGAYGPGPRIVTIPSHYGPGRSSFGCSCDN